MCEDRRVTMDAQLGTHNLDPYDALVLVSFGGPEKPEDVVPFLRNVTRGRGIPDERLEQVGEHYYAFGGKSPINDQCRALLVALRAELDGRGLDIPLVWGNRNWDPYLPQTLTELDAAGHRRVLAITTSAYPSYSSCRQYRENLYDAVQGTSLQVDKIRQYATHPGFVQASIDATNAALESLRADGVDVTKTRLVYVTHSIPSAMEEASQRQTRGYAAWHRDVAAEVTRQVSAHQGIEFASDLAYCSRSGAPGQPWLEPDINDHLEDLASEGVESVVLIPIGFISDHMEVIYDLDTEAAATAEKLGLSFVRAATAGTHPAFVRSLVDLALERAAAARGEDPDRPVIPGGEVGTDICTADCCLNLRDPARPALCQG